MNWKWRKITMDEVWGSFRFIAELDLILFIHELGHFLAAQFLGIPVKTFAVGIGPSLGSFQFGSTMVKLGLLPLAGYNEFDWVIRGHLASQSEALLYLSGALFTFVAAGCGLMLSSESRRLVRSIILAEGRYITHQYATYAFLVLLVPLTRLWSRGADWLLWGTEEERQRSDSWVTNFWLVAVRMSVWNLSPVLYLDGGRLFFDSILPNLTGIPEFPSALPWVVLGVNTVCRLCLTSRAVHYDYYRKAVERCQVLRIQLEETEDVDKRQWFERQLEQCREQREEAEEKLRY